MGTRQLSGNKNVIAARRAASGRSYAKQIARQLQVLGRQNVTEAKPSPGKAKPKPKA